MQNLINIAQKWITFTKLNQNETSEFVNIKLKVVISEKSNSVYFGYDKSNFELLIRFEYIHANGETQTDVIIQSEFNQFINANFVNEIATRYNRILDVIETTKDKPLSFEPVGDYKVHLAEIEKHFKYVKDNLEKNRVNIAEIKLSEQKAKEIAIEKRTPKKTKKVEIKNLF